MTTLEGDVLALPRSFIIGREFTAQWLIYPLPEGITSLNKRLDLAGTFVDDCSLGVAQVTLHVVFVAEAIGAMDLDGFIRRAKRRLRGKLLGKGCLPRAAF